MEPDEKPPIKAARVSLLSGMCLRTVQERSIAGGIPSARKLGKVWVYDEDAIKAWIRRGDTVCPKKMKTKTYTSGVRFGGVASESTAGSIEKAYELALRLSRGKSATAGSRR